MKAELYIWTHKGVEGTGAEKGNAEVQVTWPAGGLGTLSCARTGQAPEHYSCVLGYWWIYTGTL